MSQEQIIIYTDGASRGNPGPTSIGVAAYDGGGQEIYSYCERISDKQTNNYGEYHAILHAIQTARREGWHRVLLRTDSELIVRQLTGHYKVRNANIKAVYRQVQEVVDQLESFAVEHVAREFNKRADALANEALDR
jgi:ribonuclease HI